MGQDAIDKVLERKPAESHVAAVAPPSVTDTGGKFYSVLGGEGLQEHFLELRFRIGLKTCFSYEDFLWFNYDPEAGCIDLEMGGYLITIKGRGLGDALFNGFKQKRVAWIKEADVEMEDHPGNATFIQEITITPPATAAMDEAEPA